ncbi:UNVERIFIED_CONTAM: hypothetical protein FKN15_048521 [Acipenser sinensis]
MVPVKALPSQDCRKDPESLGGNSSSTHFFLCEWDFKLKLRGTHENIATTKRNDGTKTKSNDQINNHLDLVWNK